MVSNIRFQVHSYDESEDQNPMNTPVTEYLEITSNPIDALFTLINITNIMEPMMENYDPLDFVLYNSITDQELHRQSNIFVNIESQLYETTEKKYDSCPICIEKYKNDEEVSVLNCGHIYHPKCIKEWGHYKPSCPLCKEVIPLTN